jgi:hypothetical protein
VNPTLYERPSAKHWRRSLLSETELKSWLHRNLDDGDKLLLVLSSFNQPCQVKEIRERAASAGLRSVMKWNISQRLANKPSLALRTPFGWELTDSGKQHLRNLGVSKLSAAAVQVAVDLRLQLARISDLDTKAFVEEAVKCYEAELFRSSVVMSWLASVHVLYRHVIMHHLSAFNAEASRLDLKWKSAKTIDDLSRMKEKDFLDRLSAISVLGKNVKN